MWTRLKCLSLGLTSLRHCTCVLHNNKDHRVKYYHVGTYEQKIETQFSVALVFTLCRIGTVATDCINRKEFYDIYISYYILC